MKLSRNTKLNFIVTLLFITFGATLSLAQTPSKRKGPPPMFTPNVINDRTLPNKPEIEGPVAPPELETPPFLKSPVPPRQPEPLPIPDEIEERQASPDLRSAPQKPCPKTIVLQAPPPPTTTPYGPDFPSTPGPQWIEPNFNGTTPNRHVRHTFQWQGCKECCCEVQKAKLVVTVKALQNGQSHQSPDAGNDSISLWKNGSVLYWQYLWPNTGVSAGTTTTLTIPIAPSWLNGYRLSFLVQDDTAVLNAKLVVTGCCVKPNIQP